MKNAQQSGLVFSSGLDIVARQHGLTLGIAISSDA
jgi:hypothetical protein